MGYCLCYRLRRVLIAVHQGIVPVGSCAESIVEEESKKSIADRMGVVRRGKCYHICILFYKEICRGEDFHGLGVMCAEWQFGLRIVMFHVLRWIVLRHKCLDLGLTDIENERCPDTDLSVAPLFLSLSDFL